MIPGWPCSFVAALECGRTSWCQLLDAVRLGPEDDVGEVTAVQVRRVVEDLIAGGRWHEDDPDVLVVFDAGYDAPRAWPTCSAACRWRYWAGSARTGACASPCPGHGSHRPRAGARPSTAGSSALPSRRPGASRTRPPHRPPTGTAPPGRRPGTASEGTLIRLEADRLPGGGDALPLWLWSSATGMADSDINVRWQAFLRRFDLEHIFRMVKQTLGWTRPKLRTPQAADRWTWLIITAHTQLRLACPLAEDVRHPWERPIEPNKLTPARVRGGFRNLRPTLPCPAREPKPSRPGPGWPLGSKNKQPATRYDVGKTARRPESIIERDRARP